MKVESEINVNSTDYLVEINNGGIPVSSVTTIAIPAELAIDQNSETASPTVDLCFLQQERPFGVTQKDGL